MEKKICNILKVMAVAMLVTACGNDDMTLTLPDGYGELSFSVGNSTTRAAAGYLTYDYDRDPHTMGVIGWYDVTSAADLSVNKMFENLEVTATPDDDTGELSWVYSPLRYWVDYADYNIFDNFAYMPYQSSGVSVTRNDKVYTLSMDVDFGTGKPFSEEEVLMCNLPDHKNDAQGTITFKMDQALSAYQLAFQLDENMSDLRYFVIKDVKVYGEGFQNKGTVSREYTMGGNEVSISWSAGDITWDLSSSNNFDVTEENAVSIPYHDNSANSPAGKDWTEYYKTVTETVNEEEVSYGVLRVNKDSVTWGRPIYLIPATGFNPVFEVTYDDVVVNEDGDDVVTRRDVKSTIEFSSDFFEKLARATPTVMGKSRVIYVRVVPDHLYVLADADQTFGTITVP